MRTFFCMLGGFVGGAGLALGLGLLIPHLMQVSQAEGAYAMGLVFFWMPAGAVAGSIIALIARLARR